MERATITLDARAQRRLYVLNHVLAGELSAAGAAAFVRSLVERGLHGVRLIMRLVGMILAEQDDEWQDGRRYFRPETMALIDAPRSEE